MNSLFTPYYFESEEDCHKYMRYNWRNQKYHIQTVEPIDGHSIPSMGEQNYTYGKQ
jgi:hypothetical protein